ncbi:SSU ribosomal protein S17E [Enterospora canceri]|uniref:SSU ribosomal protein S17E n=1 Tax=Enterospora canceri TaxID=1081671 RepID=A0A1Y1S9B3_9MICR|nr:SSU ribosomal protein S17E [Enterospora canceri]
MGKIRGRAIKNAAKSVVEKYFSRCSVDFENNLALVKDVTVTQNKKTRNCVAGYITHLIKRIQKGEVKNVHIKAHEEEKERKESFIPSEGVMDVDKMDVDPITLRMLQDYGIMGNYVAAEDATYY